MRHLVPKKNWICFILLCGCFASVSSLARDSEVKPRYDYAGNSTLSSTPTENKAFSATHDNLTIKYVHEVRKTNSTDRNTTEFYNGTEGQQHNATSKINWNREDEDVDRNHCIEKRLTPNISKIDNLQSEKENLLSEKETIVPKFNIKTQHRRRKKKDVKNLAPNQNRYETDQLEDKSQSSESDTLQVLLTLLNSTEKQNDQQDPLTGFDDAEENKLHQSMSKLRTYLTHANTTESLLARNNEANNLQPYESAADKIDIDINKTEHTKNGIELLSIMPRMETEQEIVKRLGYNFNRNITRNQGANETREAIATIDYLNLRNKINGLLNAKDATNNRDQPITANENDIARRIAEEYKEIVKNRPDQYPQRSTLAREFLFGIPTTTFDSLKFPRMRKVLNLEAKQRDGRQNREKERAHIKTLVDKILGGHVQIKQMARMKPHTYRRKGLRFNNTILVTHTAPLEEEEADLTQLGGRLEVDQLIQHNAAEPESLVNTQYALYYKTRKPKPTEETATEKPWIDLANIVRRVKGSYTAAVDKVKSLHIGDYVSKAYKAMLTVPRYVLGLAESLVKLF